MITLRHSDIRTPVTIQLFATSIAVVVFIASLPKVSVAENPNDILIFVHKRTKTPNMSTTELKNYFLKIKLRWQNGKKAVVINAREGSALRNDFQKRVLEMDPRQERMYWQDRKIKIGISIPPEFTNLQKAVFNISGSMSYVYRSQYREGVTEVVFVIPAKK
jgi:hypothetical protein